MKICFFTYAVIQWAPAAVSRWSIAGAAAFFVTVLLTVLAYLVFRRTTGTRKPSPPMKKQKTPVIDYDHLFGVIKKQNGRMNSLLLAANSLNDLPVTVPVNLAVRLARTRKCLLIDLDLRRNAVAQVFEVQTETDRFKTGSHTTQIENLSIWPARNFELLRHMNLRLLIEGALKKYDFVLIYAPYLTTLPDRRQVAACARQAIAFTGTNGTQLMQLLKQCNCKVMQEI